MSGVGGGGGSVCGWVFQTPSPWSLACKAEVSDRVSRTVALRGPGTALVKPI